MKRPNRKVIASIITTLAIIVAGVAAMIIINQPPAETPVVIEKFDLSSDLFENTELKEIDAAAYQELIAEKKSFLVLIHMSICPAELPLTDTTKQLIRQNNFTVYSILQDDFKETTLADSIKYLPSMAIIKDGELVTFLDAESNEHLPHYKDPASLKSWVETYVNL